MSIETRARIKAKKPTFSRRDAQKKKRLSFSWRSKRGKTNKIGLKGFPRAISPGWRSPVSVRGLTRSGKKPIVVSTSKELLAITKDQVAVLSRTLGNRKRAELLALCVEKKIALHNVKDAKIAQAKIRADLTSRKDAKQKERLAAEAKKATTNEKKSQVNTSSSKSKNTASSMSKEATT